MNVEMADETPIWIHIGVQNEMGRGEELQRTGPEIFFRNH